MPFDLLGQRSSSVFRQRAVHPLAGVTILQIVPDLDTGGAGRAAIDIAAASSDVGAKAFVAGRAGAMVSELQAKGGTFIPFPVEAKNPLGMALNMRRLARLIEAEGIDIVHARSRLPAWIGFGATRRTRTAFVTTYLASYGHGSALGLRYNSVMARGDAVLAESDQAAELVARLHPAAAGNIRIIRRGVDSRIFAPEAVGPSRIRALRRDWNIAPDEPIVLFASPLPLPREPGIVLETARRMSATSASGTKFILIGGEPESAIHAIDTQAVSQDAQRQDILRRIGRCADLPAALLAASIVVVPTRETAWYGQIAVEAQAMGTPVIVGAWDARGETVLAPPHTGDAMRTGWRVDSDDAVALATAISTVLRLGAAARDGLAMRARAHVETRFSIAHMCEETLAAYAGLQNGHDPT